MGIGITNGIGPVSRRAFLRGGATLAVLGMAPAAWARSTAKARTRNPLARSRFTPHVGAKFRMRGDGHDVEVVLTKVSNLIPVMRAEDPNRFALLLKAPYRHLPVEGIRTFHHRAFGDVTLFVSPVDRGVDGRYYEAVINRAHK
ncbi:MAG TPA: hypothetical protein VG294_00870 [Solirubrobacteraceae bacterium]|nr:hypothetical protein [Solirubrobacteraceae bacterium]